MFGSFFAGLSCFILKAYKLTVIGPALGTQGSWISGLVYISWAGSPHWSPCLCVCLTCMCCCCCWRCPGFPGTPGLECVSHREASHTWWGIITRIYRWSASSEGLFNRVAELQWIVVRIPVSSQLVCNSILVLSSRHVLTAACCCFQRVAETSRSGALLYIRIRLLTTDTRRSHGTGARNEHRKKPRGEDYLDLCYLIHSK